MQKKTGCIDKVHSAAGIRVVCVSTKRYIKRGSVWGLGPRCRSRCDKVQGRVGEGVAAWDVGTQAGRDKGGAAVTTRRRHRRQDRFGSVPLRDVLFTVIY